MLVAVIDDMLIDFVHNGKRVILDAQLGNELQLVIGEDLAGRVRWVADQNGLRALLERVFQHICVEIELRRYQRNENRLTVSHDGLRAVILKIRGEHDDLVAGVRQGKDRVDHGLGRADGHDDVRIRVNGNAHEPAALAADRAAEIRRAHRDRVLVNRAELPVRLKEQLARVLFQLKTWGMAEIFLAGVLVSFVKLMAYGSIGVGSSFLPWCLFCVLQLRAFQCVDRRWLWDDIAPMPELRQPLKPGVTGIRQGLRSCSCCTAILPADEPVCPRCSTKGYVRRRNSLQWTLALLVTSIMLYLPANILPIMVTDLLGSKMPSTILAGVILLWSEGSYPVAAVIFLASIMVPTLKMIAIAWLCWDAKGHGKRDSERMHLIYEVVEFVGRWSMIDVFVIAVLSALVRMGGLMSIYPAMGALMFALVVIMTMFSAMTFDPRLSWDRQPESEHEES